MRKLFRKITASLVICAFSTVQIFPIGFSLANAQVIPSGVFGGVLNLPMPGTMLSVSPNFSPPIIRGLTVYPDNPLRFGFIIDSGDDRLGGEAFKTESEKLIKYFLAALTTPEDEFWVNLSPYEKDRIIPDGLGVTELGRDMLAQDYLLKQLTASLMYPEKELGKKFWDRVYTKAQKMYGTTEIPVNTFNKIWIVPDKAVVYEHEGKVFVGERHLKVMLEEDYLARDTFLAKKTLNKLDFSPTAENGSAEISSQIIKEIIIPEIEKEVNDGELFANLRQIYNSMILATWYKKSLRESLLGQVYVDQNKVQGIDLKDKQVKQKIYDQYLKAFKIGVYDYIKEDYDPATKETIPRKYFSGGLGAGVVRVRDLETRQLADLPIEQHPDIIGPESDGVLREAIVDLYDVGEKGDIEAVKKAAGIAGSPIDQNIAEKSSHVIDALVERRKLARLIGDSVKGDFVSVINVLDAFGEDGDSDQVHTSVFMYTRSVLLSNAAEKLADAILIFTEENKKRLRDTTDEIINHLEYIYQNKFGVEHLAWIMSFEKAQMDVEMREYVRNLFNDSKIIEKTLQQTYDVFIDKSKVDHVSIDLYSKDGTNRLVYLVKVFEKGERQAQYSFIMKISRAIADRYNPSMDSRNQVVLTQIINEKFERPTGFLTRLGDGRTVVTGYFADYPTANEVLQYYPNHNEVYTAIVKKSVEIWKRLGGFFINDPHDRQFVIKIPSVSDGEEKLEAYLIDKGDFSISRSVNFEWWTVGDGELELRPEEDINVRNLSEWLEPVSESKLIRSLIRGLSVSENISHDDPDTEMMGMVNRLRQSILGADVVIKGVVAALGKQEAKKFFITLLNDSSKQKIQNIVELEKHIKAFLESSLLAKRGIDFNSSDGSSQSSSPIEKAVQLISKRVQGEIDPREYYFNLQETVDPRKKVLIDLGEEYGQRAIDAILELGEEFIPLLVEPGISVRVGDFIDFAREIIDEYKNNNELLSLEEVREIRNRFEAHLGEVTVYRSVRVSSDTAENMLETGIRGLTIDEKLKSPEELNNVLLNYLKRGVRDDMLSKMADQRTEEHRLVGAGRFLISVTKIEQLAKDVAMKKELYDEEIYKQEAYLFEIILPRIYLLEVSNDFFPFRTHEEITGSMGLSSPYDFRTKLSDGREFENSDSQVESFIEISIVSQWIKSVDQIPETTETFQLVNRGIGALLNPPITIVDSISGNLVELLQSTKERNSSVSVSLSQPDDSNFFDGSSPQAGSPVTKGGIDFNPELLDLQIKRDGNGIPLPVSQQPIEHMNIQGFFPVIINISPITVPMILGWDMDETDSPLHQATLDPIDFRDHMLLAARRD